MDCFLLICERILGSLGSKQHSFRVSLCGQPRGVWLFFISVWNMVWHLHLMRPKGHSTIEVLLSPSAHDVGRMDTLPLTPKWTSFIPLRTLKATRVGEASRRTEFQPTVWRETTCLIFIRTCYTSRKPLEITEEELRGGRSDTFNIQVRLTGTQEWLLSKGTIQTWSIQFGVIGEIGIDFLFIKLCITERICLLLYSIYSLEHLPHVPQKSASWNHSLIDARSRSYRQAPSYNSSSIYGSVLKPNCSQHKF